MYKVNPEALPTKWDKKINMTDVTKLKIYVNSNDCFEARNLNIFTNYILTFFSADPISKWLSKCDLSFYQNQLNFAVWCASAGCGMSVEHLTSTHRLLSSVFTFHLYYQTRKILEEMNCPIPGDPIFTIYNYAFRLGYRPVRLMPYNTERFQFVDQSRTRIIKIDYVRQDAAIDGWKQFIPDVSQGFTRAGAVRIDDGIRNYVHCRPTGCTGSNEIIHSDIVRNSTVFRRFTRTEHQKPVFDTRK
jgi:hypothetical protein